MTDQADPIPWYRSKVLQGVAVTLVTQILAHLHIANTFTDADLSAYVDDAFELVSFVAAATAGWHRIQSPTPPIIGSRIANGTPPANKET